MRPLVSVCVPTYKRPAYLELALRSVIEQRYEPLEIVIGDDSPDESTVAVVERARNATTMAIRYQHNRPALGQSANVDDLFKRARGDYVVLLHDDDTLLPDAIVQLMQPVLDDSAVRVTFGKQLFIDGDGALLVDETRARQRLHDDGLARRAVQDPIQACLLQQFSNDGFLVETALARQVGYRSPQDIVACVDADFGIRLGRILTRGQMAFVDAPVSAYRRSSDAISVSVAWRRRDEPADAVKLHQLVTSLELSASAEYTRAAFMKVIIDPMVKGFAQQGKRVTALRLYMSPWYGWRKRLSLRGAYHLALIALPSLDALRRY